MGYICVMIDKAALAMPKPCFTFLRQDVSRYYVLRNARY